MIKGIPWVPLGTRLRFQSLLRFNVVSKKMIPKNHRSTKTRNPETESRKRKRNTESNINDRKLKNFTLRNLVQSKENLSRFSLNFPYNLVNVS